MDNIIDHVFFSLAFVIYFREKVTIPYDKPYIILKGQGKRRTRVVWDDHLNIAQSPTFTSSADNIVVKCISFEVCQKCIKTISLNKSRVFLALDRSPLITHFDFCRSLHVSFFKKQIEAVDKLVRVLTF